MAFHLNNSTVVDSFASLLAMEEIAQAMLEHSLHSTEGGLRLVALSATLLELDTFKEDPWQSGSKEDKEIGFQRLSMQLHSMEKFRRPPLIYLIG